MCLGAGAAAWAFRWGHRRGGGGAVYAAYGFLWVLGHAALLAGLVVTAWAMLQRNRVFAVPASWDDAALLAIACFPAAVLGLLAVRQVMVLFVFVYADVFSADKAAAS
jgi:hypothetical protein